MWRIGRRRVSRNHCPTSPLRGAGVPAQLPDLPSSRALSVMPYFSPIHSSSALWRQPPAGWVVLPRPPGVSVVCCSVGSHAGGVGRSFAGGVDQPAFELLLLGRSLPHPISHLHFAMNQRTERPGRALCSGYAYAGTKTKNRPYDTNKCSCDKGDFHVAVPP